MKINFMKAIFTDCSKLLINGKIIKGALKGNPTIVKFQIICRVQFDTLVEDVIFLIAPNLGKNCIIGYDTIEELKILIDPELQVICFKEKKLCVPFLKQNQSFHAEESHNMSLISDVNEIQLQGNNPENFCNFKEEVDKKLLNNNICAQEKKDLAALICEFQEIFTNKPGLIKNFTYHLNVKNTEPFYVKPYPIPMKYQEKVEVEIQKMLDNGIIRRSTSNFINPMMVAIKPNGDLRLCLDARELNKRLEEDRESPPALEEIFMQCHDMQIMTSIDFTSSFWQIELAEEDRKFTAFIINGKVYEFNRVPFGLKVSTGALLRALDMVFAN